MRKEIRSTPIRTSGAKLNELRSKTDRDLKKLLERSVDRAFQLLRDGQRGQAESTHALAVALLPLVSGVPAREHDLLEKQIDALRAELNLAQSWTQLAS